MQLVDLHKFKISCSNCNLAELCLPRGLSNDEMDELDKVVRQTRPLHKGDHLFRSGDPLSSLYAVRSGSIKLYIHSNDGDEQIIGFYLPGEIIGLDGMEHNSHSCSAVALETSSSCTFPYTQLTDVCKKIPALQDQMFRLMGREISYENKLLLTISKKSAEERIATFLSSLSLRFRQLGFSADEFKLSMSRQEIGNYLGLTIETVSRIFSRFQKKEYIAIDRKYIQILDRPSLEGLCKGNSSDSKNSSACS
ncbi:MAG: fumarate/nitrate reduction transcriptional regulator Fnr [Gammaproteobacteria bacterium]|jgi:CRP/FNR family transcriptional regulator, anaerobic regulatory protein|nr:fumarate/nitrate reduction transcriptional regulator Fnr [Gammaproteobacteria bacterium]